MSLDVDLSGQGRLHAEAGLGVVIRISDGQGNEFGTGVGRLDLIVPEGLYAVDWSTASTTAESVVRVVGGGEISVGPPWISERPDIRSESNVFDLVSYGRSASDKGDFLLSSHGDSTKAVDRSSLIVDLVGLYDGQMNETDLEHANGIMRDLRILDGSEREIDSVELPPSGRTAKAWAEVTPGRYRLRFRSLSGELLDQVVPVLKDRTTVVRMQIADATVIVHGGEGFTNTRSRGVDPTRTVVVTSVMRDAREGFDEQFGLAGMLLRDLAAATSSLSEEFIERLNQPATDPLLRIYGALVILSCLENGIAPALDEDWPDDEQHAASITQHWGRRAADLLGTAHRTGMPPDAVAGLWQVEQLLGTDVASVSRKAAASIRMPPMLECAWRWAIARSTVDRSALQDFASIRAVTKSAGGTSPWLCWNAAAAKGLKNPAQAATDGELETLFQSVLGKARQLRERQELSRSDQLSLRALPAEVAATALRAEQVWDLHTKGGQERGSPVAALSVALSLPLAVLAARLLLTDRELNGALEKLTGDPRRGIDENTDAPGWKKRVRFADDPNRGRFGGKCQRDGFTLQAEFVHTKNKNWATIHLSIIGPFEFEGAAVIYLHNSFKPPRYLYRFREGIVRDKLTAWGGFTVGAWIPARAIELELNLAEVEGAPRIIRER